jgi:diguanylate cyclase (GGDEF)-like protein
MDALPPPQHRVDDLALHTAMQHVVDTLPVGVAVALEDGTVVEVNEALLQLLGVDRETALKTPADDLVGTAGERAFTRADGRRTVVRVSVSRTALTVYAVEDLTSLKELEAALRDRALIDPVTGLPNRYLLEDRLQQALAQRDVGEVAVLFVDLDGFKAVNDSAGHRAGDEVLREAGRRIAASARVGDTVARWAGDEFVVLCSGLRDRTDVELIARRVAEACAQPFRLGDRVFALGASVGLALGRPGSDADALLDHADKAMYADNTPPRA